MVHLLQLVWFRVKMLYFTAITLHYSSLGPHLWEIAVFSPALTNHTERKNSLEYWSDTWIKVFGALTCLGPWCQMVYMWMGISWTELMMTTCISSVSFIFLFQQEPIIGCFGFDLKLAIFLTLSVDTPLTAHSALYNVQFLPTSSCNTAAIQYINGNE